MAPALLVLQQAVTCRQAVLYLKTGSIGLVSATRESSLRVMLSAQTFLVEQLRAPDAQREAFQRFNELLLAVNVLLVLSRQQKV